MAGVLIKEIRENLGIERGNGTVIRLEVAPQYKIPRMESIIRDLSWHYALRDILSEHSPTKLLIRNLNNLKILLVVLRKKLPLTITINT